MPDVVDKATRSRMMSGIRGTNTKPEIVIRKGLHNLGFRFRLHVRSLPGKPDLVFPRYRAVIFVNGCFWHRHGCHLFKWPSTRRDFWKTKLDRNVEVDERAVADLQSASWRVLTIWECSLKGRFRIPDPAQVIQEVADWLISDERTGTITGLDTTSC